MKEAADTIDRHVGKVRIRSAAGRDIPAITEIYNQVILRSTATFDTVPKDHEERRAWLEGHAPEHPVLVAEENGEVLGWASLDPWSDRSAYSATVVDTLHVRENARGRGIGKALLAVLMDCAREKGIHTVMARIAGGNEASVRLHERFGFKPVGVMREVGLKFGRLLDVHLMQKIFD
jgi:L-amino acid N-acyltransferase YncA